MNMNITSYNSNFNNCYLNNIQDNKIIAKTIINEDARINNLSYSSNVIRKIDNFLNLSSNKSLIIDDLNEKEIEQFFKILAALLKKGIVGYKYYEINGKIEKHDITVSLGDSRLYNAKVVRSGYYA